MQIRSACFGIALCLMVLMWICNPVFAKSPAIRNYLKNRQPEPLLSIQIYSVV